MEQSCCFNCEYSTLCTQLCNYTCGTGCGTMGSVKWKIASYANFVPTSDFEKKSEPQPEV